MGLTLSDEWLGEGPGGSATIAQGALVMEAAIPSHIENTGTAWTSVSKAIAEIQSPGTTWTPSALPEVGATNTTMDTNSKLWLVEQRIVVDSRKHARVSSHYRRFNTRLNKSGTVGPDANVIVRPVTSLKQITTQRDPEGKALSVTHNGETQGGELSVLDAEMELSIEVVITTAKADLIFKTWVNHINDSIWRGGKAKTWLCNFVNLRHLDSTNTVADFRFQYDAAGWQPQIFWRDPTTGRPPSGLAVTGDNPGAREITWHKEHDFNTEP